MCLARRVRRAGRLIPALVFVPGLSSEPVVIAGAGIGGLTAALALSRLGIPVTVVERRTVLTEAGAGIQLSPNASRILVALGLGPALARRAAEPEEIVIRSLRGGSSITSLPLGQAMRERFGAPYWAILRNDLHTVLLDAARSSANIRLMVGRQVVGAQSTAEEASVLVAGAGGSTERLRTPLLIGADGLWSAVREAIPGAAAPVFRSHVAWRAVIPREKAPAALQPLATGLWLGRDAHVVHYPVAGGRLLNIVVVLRAEAPVDSGSEAGDGAVVAKALRRAAEPLRELIAAASEWRAWALYDLTPPPRWSHGRIVLMGDAAHPVLPFLAQGGALAIEDAAVLAGTVVRSDDVAAALRQYEETRRPRAERIQREAAANRWRYHLAGPMAIARNLVLRRLGPDGMLKRFAWIYGWRPEEA